MNIHQCDICGRDVREAKGHAMQLIMKIEGIKDMCADCAREVIAEEFRIKQRDWHEPLVEFICNLRAKKRSLPLEDATRQIVAFHDSQNAKRSGWRWLKQLFSSGDFGDE